MKNPFRLNGPVTGLAFCNRIDEQKLLLQFIQDSQNVLICSHRGSGKTSLVKRVLQNISDKEIDIGVVYADLCGTKSETEFVSRILKSIGALKPVCDPRSFDQGLSLDTLMRLLEKLSKDRKLVVIFDEFQEVTTYTNHELFEKRLRSYIQTHPSISYIYSGCHRQLLIPMFYSSDRAFYQQVLNLSLKRISTGDYLTWLLSIFSKSKNEVSSEILTTIIERFDNSPKLVQNFCFYLWEALQHKAWDEAMMQEIDSLAIKNKKAEAGE